MTRIFACLLLQKFLGVGFGGGTWNCLKLIRIQIYHLLAYKVEKNNVFHLDVKTGFVLDTE